MDSERVRISAFQLGILVLVSVVGVGILTLPRNIVEIAQSDGWMLIIIGGAFTMGMAMVLYTLAKRFSNQTIIEYSEDLVGRPLTILIGVIAILYYIIFAAFTVRIFGEVLKMFLLPRTPIEIIIMTFLFSVIYLVRNGLEGIVRFYEMIVLIMFVPYFLTLLSGINGTDFTNLLPVFQTPPRVLLKRAFEVSFSFIGFEAILLYIPFVSDKENVKRNLLVVIGVIALIYLFSAVIVIASFGVEETKELVWPLMSFIKSIEVPGAFIEQLEGIIMTVWVLFIYTTLSTLYFSGTFILSRITKTKEHKVFAVALLPIIYVLSLLPDNVAQTYEWLGPFSIYAGLLVVGVIPVFLLLVAIVRKKGVKANG